MSADAYRVIGKMLSAYALLHPSLRSSRDVTWEMDLDTFDALRTALPWQGSSAVFVDGAEMQCLGIRVSTIVERPGVRLVIEVGAR